MWRCSGYSTAVSLKVLGLNLIHACVCEMCFYWQICLSHMSQVWSSTRLDNISKVQNRLLFSTILNNPLEACFHNKDILILKYWDALMGWLVVQLVTGVNYLSLNLGLVISKGFHLSLCPVHLACFVHKRGHKTSLSLSLGYDLYYAITINK